MPVPSTHRRATRAAVRGRAARDAGALAALVLASACGPGLQLRRIDAAHRAPANVAVFLSVEDADGEPVAGLLASDFNVYEDGELISLDESRQTIVSSEDAASHYTLLLVDMSASVSESDQVAEIVRAARAFLARVEQDQRVAVYAFDGARDIHEVTTFAEPGMAQSLDRLAGFKTRDPATNLHGAVIQGLGELDQSLAGASTPLRFGTLVVFTDGTDRAARVPLQEMLDSIGASDYSLFAIGVGNEIDDNTLSRIGREGYIRVEDRSALSGAFDQIGERIVRYTRRYYLLSYCSPARGGEHRATIEAVSARGSGEITYDFDAHGFGPGCDANRPPPFDSVPGEDAASGEGTDSNE